MYYQEGDLLKAKPHCTGYLVEGIGILTTLT